MERSRPDFSLQRFPENSSKPIESSWSIRILHPNKRIERCTVFYDGERLPWWDKDECYYEKFICVGGGGNVRIPKGKEKDDAEVIVKDENKTLLKTLRRKKFREIPQP